MFETIGRLFGTHSARLLKSVEPLLGRIHQLERPFARLQPAELKTLTPVLQSRFDRGATLDDLLPEAFAACREAAQRALESPHVDVQLVGGIALHQGAIAEIQNGEGSALTIALAAYLNALAGRGVHVATLSPVLHRDADAVRRMCTLLGASVGLVEESSASNEVQESYRCDITYALPGTFCRDYVQENLYGSVQELLQLGHHFAIIDEIDAVLIDDARMSFTLTQSIDRPVEDYLRANEVALSLRAGIEYVVDKRSSQPTLTEAGQRMVAQQLGIPDAQDPESIGIVTQVIRSLQAHTSHVRDTDYVVEESKVVLLDPITRHRLPGRQYTGGLHQAIEAKEGLEITPASRPAARMLQSDYFRLYEKLAGVTATARREAPLFKEFFGLDVVTIPTNGPVLRRDAQDVVYKNESGKLRGVADEITDCHQRRQPVLVATRNAEQAGALRALLHAGNIPHQVLDPRHPDGETEILAQAGCSSAVTVCVGHPSRGATIVLGGNPGPLAELELRLLGHPVEDGATFAASLRRQRLRCDANRQLVIAVGGLHVIGLYRHATRRLDEQLSALVGHQSEPGSSRFFLSLDDNLMTMMAANDLMTGLLERLGLEDDSAMEQPLMSRAIANLQQQIGAAEEESMRVRASYDSVFEQQRQAIRTLRRQVLEGRYDSKSGAPLLASGPHTVDSLARDTAPTISLMAAALQRQEQSVSVLRSAIYRQFGAWLAPEHFAGGGDELFDRLAGEVASSLIQQRERFVALCEATLTDLLDDYAAGAVDMSDVKDRVSTTFCCDLEVAGATGVDRDALARSIWPLIETMIEEQELELSLPVLVYYLRHYLLEELDKGWADNIQATEIFAEKAFSGDYRSVEVKRQYEDEAFAAFTSMMKALRVNVCETLSHLALVPEEIEQELDEIEQEVTPTPVPQLVEPPQPEVSSRARPRIGRADPCPCGSGKRYERCHGAVTSTSVSGEWESE